ncbi:MAG TPA: SRPBCC domain-containing protein, partial [bacterium]|nr:SRPBCC domain-containing protein [bacterium]
MPVNTKKVLEITQPELNITRVFDAPRALVFKAWTEAPRLAVWWGPKAFSNPVCELDARPGGAMRVHMQGPDGTVYPMGGEYLEIDEPRRLVLSTFVEDEDGLVLENLVTVAFEEEGAKTRMVLNQKFTHIKARAASMVKGSKDGWTQSIDKLGDYVSTLAAPFSISRVFEAPRALVFKVHTDPVHLARWFGPAGTQVIKADMDLRPGGT